jgi:hypothetical protein
LNLIFLSLCLSLPSLSQSMGMLWSAVIDTCTPVNARCMYMYTIYLWHIFNRKVPRLWYK